MKHRITALLLGLTLTLSLAACTTPREGMLKGKQTEYSPTVAYGASAWGGVEITETKGEHSLKNKTAQLDFGGEQNGLLGLHSLQTGEVILQNTVTTAVTGKDGIVYTLTGGEDAVYQGNYGVSHGKTGMALSRPGTAEEAEVLKTYDLAETEGQKAFSALKNGVTLSQNETGLSVTSGGGNRAQFGARSLGVELGKADRYYLSVTLKAQNITGLKCYFATDTVSLTEDTLLGTLDISAAPWDDFVTLTAEIDHALWYGTLQTLLFRLPTGETGSLEISKISLLAGNDPLTEKAGEERWTVYSDRIYYSHQLTLPTENYASAVTVFALEEAKCTDLSENENGIGIQLIDGSVLGFVKPTDGTLRVERNGKILKILAEWNPNTFSLALGIYLEYTETYDPFFAFAARERNPLTAEDFVLENATFNGYDPKGGMYRITPTGEEFTVTLSPTDRAVYLFAPPKEGQGWSIYDKNGHLLPLPAGTTFPLKATEKKITVTLKATPAGEEVEIPSFFAESGLKQLSRTSSVLNGLCAQNTSVYSAPDGSYTVALTSTKLEGGKAEIYDISYTFHTRKSVSDLAETFPFFSFGLEYGFEEYFYFNGENETISLPAGSEDIAYLGAMPYLGLKNDTEEATWIVAGGQMTVSGKPSTAHLCLRYQEVEEDKPNKFFLAFDGTEAEFIKGDTLTAKVIRIDGSYDEKALKTLRDSGNFQVIQKEHKKVKTFTALGMEETVMVQIEGFDRYIFPEITVNGEEYTPEYHVYVDGGGYYGFAFAVPNGATVSITD